MHMLNKRRQSKKKIQKPYVFIHAVTVWWTMVILSIWIISIPTLQKPTGRETFKKGFCSIKRSWLNTCSSASWSIRGSPASLARTRIPFADTHRVNVSRLQKIAVITRSKRETCAATCGCWARAKDHMGYSMFWPHSDCHSVDGRRSLWKTKISTKIKLAQKLQLPSGLWQSIWGQNIKYSMWSFARAASTTHTEYAHTLAHAHARVRTHPQSSMHTMFDKNCKKQMLFLRADPHRNQLPSIVRSELPLHCDWRARLHYCCVCVFECARVCLCGCVSFLRDYPTEILAATSGRERVDAALWLLVLEAVWLVQNCISQQLGYEFANIGLSFFFLY